MGIKTGIKMGGGIHVWNWDICWSVGEVLEWW